MARYLKLRLAVWAVALVAATAAFVGAPFFSEFRVCEDQVAGDRVVTVCSSPSLGAVPLYVAAGLGVLLFSPELLRFGRAVRTISLELGQLKVSAELEAVKQVVLDVRETTDAASHSVESLVAEQRRRRVEDIATIDLEPKVEQLRQWSADSSPVSDSDRAAFAAAVNALLRAVVAAENGAQADESLREWRLVFEHDLQSLRDALGAVEAGEFVSLDVLSRGRVVADQMREALVGRAE